MFRSTKKPLFDEKSIFANTKVIFTLDTFFEKFFLGKLPVGLESYKYGKPPRVHNGF